MALGANSTHSKQTPALGSLELCSQRLGTKLHPPAETALAPPGPQPNPPESQHQLWDTLNSSTSHLRIQSHSPAPKWASTSFGTFWNPQPAMSRTATPPTPNPKQNSMPTLGLGRLSSAIIHLRTQLCPTSEPALALGPTRVPQPAASRLGPTNQCPAASTQGRAWQTTRLGANHDYQVAHSSRPTTKEDPCSPQRGHSWSIWLGD